MSKRSLIICICAAALLIAGLVAAVFFLYSGVDESKSSTSSGISERIELLSAVPSDAAAVMIFQSLAKGNNFVSDKSGLPGYLLSPQSLTPVHSFISMLEANQEAAGLSSSAFAISLHYSGSLVPLLCIDAGPDANDSTDIVKAARSAAGDAGLFSAFVSGNGTPLLLFSQSETLLNSARRHLEGGISILDNKHFNELLSKITERNAVFFSHSYAGKLISAYFDKSFSKYSQFVQNSADWTGFCLKEPSGKCLTLKGESVYGKGASYFMNLLSSLPSGDCKASEVLPSSISSAVLVATPQPSVYQEGYQKFVDASTKMGQYRKNSDMLRKSAGISPSEWAENIREAVSAVWTDGEGKEYRAVFVRRAKSQKSNGELVEYKYSGFAAVAFGSAFGLEDESTATECGDWIISGSREAVENWKSIYEGGEPRFQTLIPSKDMVAAACFVSSDIKLLSYSSKGLVFEEGIPSSDGEKEAVPVKGGKVEIPAGPFEVVNCATGKTNYFYQNEQKALCLKDENGKGMWGVPFKGDICGSVVCVDYYANGKIQFLFASGQKLYLIDRLGRFVSGFPISIDKEVLLGPSVYDFSGAKAYTAMVLHKDNTVGMYDLHGKSPEKWKGIACPDQIMELPRLIKTEKGEFWAVTTRRETLYFDFWGGEHIKDKKTLSALK